jgi:hypothetical protein
MNSSFDNIVAAVRAEREYQNQRWGEEFDNKNTPNDWLAFIGAYIGRAFTFPFDAIAFKKGLVKVAAVCFAAIEACDRAGGNMPKRHYD